VIDLLAAVLALCLAISPAERERLTRAAYPGGIRQNNKDGIAYDAQPLLADVKL
jgi:hypothetical protein